MPSPKLLDATGLCSPGRESLFKRTGSCLTQAEKGVLLHGSGYQKNRILDVALRPKQPLEWQANPRYWLNTNDINAVLTQYEQKHERFVYLGAHPRDFGLKGTHTSCVLGAPVQLCNFDVRSFLASGKWDVGVVFNLDARDEPGSHWVALYANFNPRQPDKLGAYYLDSGAQAPPRDHIGLFLEHLERQARAIPGLEAFRSHVNGIPVQRKNTECGVYASLFLIRCLEDWGPKRAFHSFEDVVAGLGDDDEVWRYRKVLFRSPDASVPSNAAYDQRINEGGKVGGRQTVVVPRKSRPSDPAKKGGSKASGKKKQRP